MLCQLERLEIAEIEKKKEEAAEKEGVGKEGGSKEEPVEEPIVYQVSYLGHVVGARAKKFYDQLKLKHWYREDDGEGGGHWTPDLVTWEALAMGPARIMCRTGRQMSMTDQREIMTRVNEEEEEELFLTDTI